MKLKEGIDTFGSLLENLIQNLGKCVFLLAAITALVSTTSVFATSYYHFQKMNKGYAFTSDTFEEITGVSDTNSFLVLGDPDISGVQSIFLITAVNEIPQQIQCIGFASQVSSVPISDDKGNFIVSRTVDSVTVDLSFSVADGMYQIVTENGWTGVIQGYSFKAELNSSTSGHSSLILLRPMFYALELTPSPKNHIVIYNAPGCAKQYTLDQLNAINADDIRKSHCADVIPMLQAAGGGVLLGVTVGAEVGTLVPGAGNVFGGICGGVLGLFGGPVLLYYNCNANSEIQFEIDKNTAHTNYTQCLKNSNLAPLPNNIPLRPIY